MLLVRGRIEIEGNGIHVLWRKPSTELVAKFYKLVVEAFDVELLEVSQKITITLGRIISSANHRMKPPVLMAALHIIQTGGTLGKSKQKVTEFRDTSGKPGLQRGRQGRTLDSIFASFMSLAKTSRPPAVERPYIQ
jgi:hypothetical protein